MCTELPVLEVQNIYLPHNFVKLCSLNANNLNCSVLCLSILISLQLPLLLVGFWLLPWLVKSQEVIILKTLPLRAIQTKA